MLNDNIGRLDRLSEQAHKFNKARNYFVFATVVFVLLWGLVCAAGYLQWGSGPRTFQAFAMIGFAGLFGLKAFEYRDELMHVRREITRINCP